MDVPANAIKEVEISEQNNSFEMPLKKKYYLSNDLSDDDPRQRMSFQRQLESVLLRDFKQEESEARQRVKGYQNPNVVEFDEIKDRVSRFGASIYAKGSVSSVSNFHASDIPKSFDESLKKEFEATQKRISQFKHSIH